MIHLENGQAKFTHMGRQGGFNGGTAGNQYNLMRGQSPANFESAKKMADAENILAVLDNFHNVIGSGFSVQRSAFRVQRSGLEIEKYWIPAIQFFINF
jgi:hypothetical protein